MSKENMSLVLSRSFEWPGVSLNERVKRWVLQNTYERCGACMARYPTSERGKHKCDAKPKTDGMPPFLPEFFQKSVSGVQVTTMEVSQRFQHLHGAD